MWKIAKYPFFGAFQGTENEFENVYFFKRLKNEIIMQKTG